MSANNESLQKLIRTARRVPPSPAAGPSDSLAPLGFSTRVAARWASGQGRPGCAEIWERVCWWGAGASVAVCLTAFASQSLQSEPDPFDTLMDAPADVLEML